MNNNQAPEDLRELNWRRKLTPSEAARLRAWLEAHPEAEVDCDLEAALTDALDRMPCAPVSSNFTARVLQAVELDAARERSARQWRFWQWRPAWLPRVAVVAVVLGLAVVSVEQIHRTREQEELARRLAAVPVVAEVPSPEILQDYDAIRQLSNPAPDEQLLSLMQ